MKRIISLTILIVFLMSLLYVVPAEAAFFDEQIYMSLGFEDGVAGFSGTGNPADVISFVDEGANGTNGALKIHRKSATSGIRVNIPNVENLKGKKIKVSFWAKWDETANDGIVLKRLTPGGVMYFPHSGGNAYVVGYKSGTYAPDKFMQGEWTYFEFDIPTWSNLKNPDGSWNGKDGASNSEKDRFDYNYVKSRGIYLDLRLFDGSGGDFRNALKAASKDPTPDFPEGGVVWYLDDFKFETEEGTPSDTSRPIVSNLEVDNDNLLGNAVISYDYTPGENAAQSKSVITISKQLADGKTAILKQDICTTVANKGEYRFEITEDMLGEKLVYSVQPFDKTIEDKYIQGTVVTHVAISNVKHRYIITPGEFVFGTDSITSSIAVTNNSTEDLDILMIVALYDAEGHLIGYDDSLNTKHLQVLKNTTKDTDNSLTVSVTNEVKSAKVFFWNGTSIDDVVAQGISDSLTATR